MTVKELNEVMSAKTKFLVADSGLTYPLERDCHLTMAVYGDCVVAAVLAIARDTVEIHLKLQPVKQQG